MLRELDIGGLMTGNLFPKCRYGFGVFPILFSVGLELDFEVAYVTLEGELILPLGKYKLTSLAAFLSVNFASRPLSSET
jgi:hypothetical protein